MFLIFRFRFFRGYVLRLYPQNTNEENKRKPDINGSENYREHKKVCPAGRLFNENLEAQYNLIYRGVIRTVCYNGHNKRPSTGMNLRTRFVPQYRLPRKQSRDSNL